MNVILLRTFGTETAERHGNVDLETRRKLVGYLVDFLGAL